MARVEYALVALGGSLPVVTCAQCQTTTFDFVCKDRIICTFSVEIAHERCCPHW